MKKNNIELIQGRPAFRVRVGRRAARRLGLGSGGSCRGWAWGRCFALPSSVPPRLACRGLWGLVPSVSRVLPFCLCLGFVVSAALLGGGGGFAAASLASVPLALRPVCVGGSLGRALGPWFGRAFCAVRSFPAPVSARLVGVAGVVRLFPCALGGGLCLSPGLFFPRFVCLPSGVLVPVASVLVGSSFFSPVCAGRLCRPSRKRAHPISGKIFQKIGELFDSIRVFIRQVGILKNIQQLRGIPNPTGLPSVQYIPYDFGFMKPLHVVPFTIDLTLGFQTFERVFIPKNEWANLKILYLKYGYKMTLAAGHDASPIRIQQYYYVQPTGPIFMGQCSYDSATPTVGRGALEYRYIRIGDDIFDWGFFEILKEPLIAKGLGEENYIKCNGGLAAVDYSNPINFDQAMNCIGALPGDSLEIEWAQASIQSPLDLGRLPR
jgi:hypothetical protein